MKPDVRGRASRERLVHTVATPETIRKLDSETVGRLFERGFLRGEQVNAWEEINEAWQAASRDLSIRLMRFSEPTDKGRAEVSERLQHLVSKMWKWADRLESEARKLEFEVIIATVQGHSLREICGLTAGPRFERTKTLLRRGLTEYCLMHGMLDVQYSRV